MTRTETPETLDDLRRLAGPQPPQEGTGEFTFVMDVTGERFGATELDALDERSYQPREHHDFTAEMVRAIPIDIPDDWKRKVRHAVMTAQARGHRRQIVELQGQGSLPALVKWLTAKGFEAKEFHDQRERSSGVEVSW